MLIEVKARMIVREPDARRILERLLNPFAKALGWLASAIQKHPLIAVLVLAILLVLVWRLHK